MEASAAEPSAAGDTLAIHSSTMGRPSLRQEPRSCCARVSVAPPAFCCCCCCCCAFPGSGSGCTALRRLDTSVLRGRTVMRSAAPEASTCILPVLRPGQLLWTFSKSSTSCFAIVLQIYMNIPLAASMMVFLLHQQQCYVVLERWPSKHYWLQYEATPGEEGRDQASIFCENAKEMSMSRGRAHHQMEGRNMPWWPLVLFLDPRRFDLVVALLQENT